MDFFLQLVIVAIGVAILVYKYFWLGKLDKKRRVKKLLRQLEFVKADYDGAEVTVFSESGEPFTREEFTRGTVSWKRLVLMKFEFEKYPDEPLIIEL